VEVDIFSVGYRIPFYALGDSLDLIYGKSSVNTPSSSPTLGGALGIVGKGDVFGARWNHYFTRRGEYTSKLTAGFDYKYINARCTDHTNGVADPDTFNIDPPTPRTGSCVPYTTRPLSLTYSGQRLSPGQMFDYSIGVAHNLALGTHYTNVDGGIDRYSYLTSGNRSTRDDFNILRLGGSYLKAFQSDWQVRVAASGQYAGNPLVAAEQLGLAGSAAVRGFNERAVSADSGYFANTEIYTPELGKTAGVTGNLRALGFLDFAHGYNHNVPAGSATPGSLSVASIGAGVRYALGKNFSLRFDLARVIDAGPVNPVVNAPISSKERGDWRGHLNVMIGF
jgi:hemolysin activation/secretion protein